MRYIMTLENYTNRSILHTGKLGFGAKGKWKTINIDGLNVNIQPHSYLSSGYDEKIVNDIIIKIKSLSNRWKLVGDINLIKKEIVSYDYSNNGFPDRFDTPFLNFRLTDVEGDSKYGTDGEIPEDIKEEMIIDINSKFKDYEFVIEEFDERGYLIIDIKLDSNK